MKPYSATYARILLIKPGAIGDLLQLTPVIRALRERYPAARITIMVSSAGTAGMFTHNPHISETMVFDRKGEHRSLPAFLELWSRVRRARFDLVVNFQRSNLKAWFLVLAAVPCRVLVYHKARGRSVHAVVNHLEAVAPQGIDPQSADPQLELVLGRDDERWAEEKILREKLDGRQLVALNIGASHAVNRWPAGHFAALADRLSREVGVAVILVGGNGDREIAEAVQSRLSCPVLDLVGRTSLLQLGAVLKRCLVTVSCDTGPMHMATAVGTPVVALFGAADPARTGPVGAGHVSIQHLDLSCVPCKSRHCAHDRYAECMDLITVDEVFAVVARLLERRRQEVPQNSSHGTGELSRERESR